MVAALQLNPKLLEVYFQHLFNVRNGAVPKKSRPYGDNRESTKIKRGKTTDQFSARYT